MHIQFCFSTHSVRKCGEGYLYLYLYLYLYVYLYLYPHLCLNNRPHSNPVGDITANCILNFSLVPAYWILFSCHLIQSQDDDNPVVSDIEDDHNAHEDDSDNDDHDDDDEDEKRWW